MRIEHEFTVDAPLGQAWFVIADTDAFAGAIPGAELRSVNGVHTGRIALDAANELICEATVVAVDRDDDDHVVTVAAHGRQLGGPAVGSAIVRSRLAAQDGSTRVALSADVLSTGHNPDGFEEGARRLFTTLGERLEQRALQGPTARAPKQLVPAPIPRGRKSKQLFAVAAGGLIGIGLVGWRRRGR